MKQHQIRHAAFGGLLGGVVFGAMMEVMTATGMLPTVGRLVGFPSVGGGFVVHLFNSAVIGALFGIVLGRLIKQSNALPAGLIYGAIWWVLGPLTLMPLLLGSGLGANWNFAAANQLFPSLMGHLTYGSVLAATYLHLRNRELDYSIQTIDRETHRLPVA